MIIRRITITFLKSFLSFLDDGLSLKSDNKKKEKKEEEALQQTLL
jgi:hypothetical protein